MYLHFSKVVLHNFFSYADAELSLEDSGYVIVSGKNNMPSDNAVSNGSGKSSIFNAVCFALTGETIQGLSNNVENIYSNPNDCWVELYFRADDDEFILRRYKTPKTDLKIFVNGEDRSGKGVRESQQILKGYIPELTSQLIGSIILLGQGMPYRFTYSNPSMRKTLLENLTKSDYMAQTIKDKLENRKEELRVQLRSFEDKLISNSTQIEIYTERYNKLLKDLTEYDSYTSEGSIEDTIKDINDTLLAYQDDVDKLTNNKSELESKIANINGEKTRLATKDKQELTDNLIKLDSDINTINISIVDKKAEIKAIEKEINKIDSIVDICPTCGQKIPNVKKIDSTDLKNILACKKEENSKLNSKYKDIIKSKEEFINEHNNKYNSELKDLDIELNSLNEDLHKLNNKYNTITANINMLFQERTKLLSLQDNYNKVVDEFNTVNINIENLNSEKLSIENEIRLFNEHLNVVQNLITLAKREFRSVLLSNVVKYLDSKAKEYSREVFGSELLSITVNENYIDVMFNNKYYEGLSGGEKQKVDIIIQLALKDLLSTQLNLHSNLLVIDEVFDNLDSIGCQKILDLISKYGNTESLFIISHHATELQISYDMEVVVEKGEDGISTITVH